MKNMMKAMMVCALLIGAVAAQDQEPPKPAAKENVTVTFEVEGKPVEVKFDQGNVQVLVEGNVAKFQQKNVQKDVELTVAYDLLTRAAVDVVATQAFLTTQEKRRVIGVEVKELEDALAAQVGVAAGDAMLIVRVRDGGPASKAGLETFDVVTAIQGQKPATLPRLRACLGKLQVGDPIILDVVRMGEEKSIRIEVGEEGPTGYELTVAPTIVNGVVTLNPVLKSNAFTYHLNKIQPAGNHFVQYHDAKQNYSFVYDTSTFKELTDFHFDALAPGAYSFGVTSEKPDAEPEPHAESKQDVLGTSRLEALEKRLERIEKLLDKLADRK